MHRDKKVVSDNSYCVFRAPLQAEYDAKNAGDKIEATKMSANQIKL
jgi:hypothetical protein